MKPYQKGSFEGFTVIELIIVLVCVAILGAIILPAFTDDHRAKQRAQRINCINNLKQDGMAFYLWASDHNGKFPMQVFVTNGGTMELAERGVVFRHFLIMSNELKAPKFLFCPADYDLARIIPNSFASTGARYEIPLTNDNQISYFVGVDASTSSPSMFLCGDRNLALDGVPAPHGLQLFPTNRFATWTEILHKGQGNVCMSDGSVQQLSSSRLRQALSETGQSTNRLAIP
jgi:prepilin-type processing-associated H-X9-DG protein